MQRRHRVALVLGTALVLVCCSFALRDFLRRPLSPAEARLVGNWTYSGGPVHIFLPDRSFRSANGQYEGEWSIADGRLTLQYWEPARPQDARSIDGFFDEMRKSGKVQTLAWEIEFRDDNQGHTLIFPEDHERDPGGRWEWTRLAE